MRGSFLPQTACAVHVLERIPWPRHGSTPASRARADAEIAAQRYDAALIASEEPEAYELAAPVAQRVGFVTGWAKPFKTWWTRRRLTTTLQRAASAARERGHEVDVLFRLGRAFGQRNEPAARRGGGIAALDRRLPCCRNALGSSSNSVPKWGVCGRRRVMRRCQIVTRALRERGARFVIAPAERAAFAARFPDLTLDAPPGVRDWIACIDGAAAVVTVDTGAAHLAGMLGVPVVDVFPDAGFEDQTRRWRPWASSSIVLRASTVVRAPETAIPQALDAL